MADPVTRQPTVDVPADRDDLVWPTRIVRPTGPSLVYLDLNHWIYLTRTAANPGSAPNGYDQLLGAARSAVSEGRALFPLSSVHYIEMSSVTDPSQRSAIATIMHNLSKFHVLLGRPTLVDLEIEAMLDTMLGERTDGDGVALLGTSGAGAFGRRGGLRIARDDGSDAADSVREQLGATHFDEVMVKMNAAVEHELLAGPSDAQVPQLRAAGWAPETTRRIADRRAEQEREQARRRPIMASWSSP